MEANPNRQTVCAQQDETRMVGFLWGAFVISTKTAAKLLGVSQRRIRALCMQHRVPGALLIAGAWILPDAPIILPATRIRPGKLTMERK